jgi:hypothetical protein
LSGLSGIESFKDQEHYVANPKTKYGAKDPRGQISSATQARDQSRLRFQVFPIQGVHYPIGDRRGGLVAWGQQVRLGLRAT